MRLRRWFGWLIEDRAVLGSISPWNAVIAEQHAANTERLLLGAAGPAKRDHSAFWSQVEGRG